jgi:hypothetical protein
MKRIILTPEEIGNLIAPWYDLKNWRLQMVSGKTNQSQIDPKRIVIDSPSLLVVPHQGRLFNLFDHHVAYKAHDKGISADALLIEKLDELRVMDNQYFIDSKVSKASLGVRFEEKEAHIENNRKNGIQTISDLSKKYAPETGIKPAGYFLFS